MAKMPDGILDIVKAKMRFETQYLTDFKHFSGVYPDTVFKKRKRCFRDRIFIGLKCFEEECPYLECKNEAECICTYKVTKYGQQIVYGGLVVFLDGSISRDKVRLCTNNGRKYVKKLEV